MAASDEHPKHGEVLDEVLRDEIKDLAWKLCVTGKRLFSVTAISR